MTQRRLIGVVRVPEGAGRLVLLLNSPKALSRASSDSVAC